MKNKRLNWLKNRLEIVFRNKRDFKDISVYEFSNLNLIFTLIICLVTIFSISFFLSTTILSMWFDPRYVERKANEELIRLSNAIDSLQYESKIKDQYIENIMVILSGGENNKLELNSQEYKLEISDVTNSYSAIDSFFRKEFENNLSLSEIINTTNINSPILDFKKTGIQSK